MGRSDPTSTAPAKDPGEKTLGLLFRDRYEILRRIATGGMGEIYLARECGIEGADRLVTIKTLLPHLAAHEESLSDFLDEARLAARLNHPGIVSILEVGCWRGVHFIAMEYVHGAALSSVWEQAATQRVGIPLFFGAEILRGAALALDHAHKARDTTGKELAIVHRDVSPQNIMVRYDGYAKLLDFGIAKSAERVERTATGMIKGKIAYMAPEQLLGRPLGAASDQFALGVILWEMGTGRRLFKGSDPVSIVKTILKGSFPSPLDINPNFPKELNAVVMRMLAPRPDDRYPSCGVVAKELNRYVSSVGRGEDAAELVRGFLARLYGEVATAPVKLEKEEVLIFGLQPELVDCPFCRASSPKNAPFCASCGHSLTGSQVPVQLVPEVEVTAKQQIGSFLRSTRTSSARFSGVNIPIIGRDGELAGVRTIIANATQGKGGGALFVGAHGAGKSRMLEGIAGIASLEGHLTARTAAHPLGENLWCRVIEAVCQALLVDSEGPPPQGADALAALCELPEIEDDLEELAIPFLERDPPLDDRLLFQLFQSYLKKTKDKSIVVLIDDLEWLQPNEADALEKLLQRCKNASITIVGAVTEGAALSLAGMRNIPLSPLSARNIHKLAELQVRGAVPKTVRQLLEVTQGLPGNVSLVLKVLVQAGALVKVNNEWLVFPNAAETTTVPLLEEYVANHIAALSPSSADFLRVISERSRPTPRAKVESHQERSVIDELLELGLLKEDVEQSTVAVAGAVVLQQLYRGDDVEL